MSYKTLLCAVDFSDFSEKILRAGIELADHFRSKLLIFHSISMAGSNLDPEIQFDPPEIRIQKAREKIAQRLENQSVDWEPIVIIGNPAEEIPAVVARTDTRLVLAGSYGFTGLRRLFWGTVVERLARQVKCPFLVLRQNSGKPHSGGDIWHPPSRILIGCDLKQTQNSVFQAALTFASTFSAEVHLLHSLERPIDLGGLDPESAAYQEIQSRLQEKLDTELKKRDESAEIPVKIILSAGHPGEAIQAYSDMQDMDLIVLGVHPKGPIQRLLIGSTTEAILRKGTCPVLAIPTGGP